MPALAIFAPSGAGNFNLRGVDGHDLNVEAMKKEIEFAACDGTPAGLDHNGSFQSIWGGDQARSVPSNEFEEILSFGLSLKYGDQSGSVEHH
jgi:hypothetical protein